MKNLGFSIAFLSILRESDGYQTSLFVISVLENGGVVGHFNNLDKNIRPIFQLCLKIIWNCEARKPSLRLATTNPIAVCETASQDFAIIWILCLHNICYELLRSMIVVDGWNRYCWKHKIRLQPSCIGDFRFRLLCFCNRTLLQGKLRNLNTILNFKPFYRSQLWSNRRSI